MNLLRLFSPRDSAWHEYLTLVPHGFFHTAEYHALSESYQGGEAWLAIYGDDQRFLAWPYLLQEIQGLNSCRSGLHDITSTYGYTGPLACKCVGDEDFLACAWSALTDIWASQGGISVFTRFHPIYVSDELISSKWMMSNVEGGPCAQGRIVVIDLTRSSTEIWDGYKRNMRRDLRRCQRAGLRSSLDPDWANLDEFLRIYYDTMKRNHAAPFYFFTADYFQRLKKALGPHGSLMITRYGNDIAAVGLFIEYGGIVNLHLLASNAQLSFLSPGKLTIHDAAVWAKSRGNRLLVLGGGRGASDDDSLFRFKARFSRTALPFYTGRWVLDRDAYETLVGEWRKLDHRAWQEGLATEYFPVYRAPQRDPGLPDQDDP